VIRGRPVRICSVPRSRGHHTSCSRTVCGPSRPTGPLRALPQPEIRCPPEAAAASAPLPSASDLRSSRTLFLSNRRHIQHGWFGTKKARSGPTPDLAPHLRQAPVEARSPAGPSAERSPGVEPEPPCAAPPLQAALGHSPAGLSPPVPSPDEAPRHPLPDPQSAWRPESAAGIRPKAASR